MRYSQTHYADVTMRVMASQITGNFAVCLMFVKAHIKNIKVPRHWPLWGDSTDDRRILSERGSNAGNSSIW